MRQEYSSMAPRGYVQQPQQPQYQQPYQQPYQQMPQQQPQYQQGFAPRGNFQPYQAMPQMEGSQEFRDAYQKNLDAFNETNRKIKEGVSESEAVKNIEKMNKFVSQVDGSVQSERGASNKVQLINSIDYLCLSLENPEEWLEENQQKYVEPINKVVVALRQIKKLISYRKPAQPAANTAPAQ